MLYASTRTSLTKSLGAAPFKDSLFATSKDDVSASAYTKHLASLNAPKPMTAREKEMDEIRQAESKSMSYEGSRARVRHVTQEIGLGWPDEVYEAVSDLGSGENSKLVILVSQVTRYVLFPANIRTSRQSTPQPRNYSCILWLMWKLTASVVLYLNLTLVSNAH
jgi:hypothetical protein